MLSAASYSCLTSSSKSPTWSGFVSMIRPSSRLSLHFFRASFATSSEQGSSPRKARSVLRLSASSSSLYYFSTTPVSIWSSILLFSVRNTFTGSWAPLG